jgi:putative salt-induced outer membrane protein
MTSSRLPLSLLSPRVHSAIAAGALLGITSVARAQDPIPGGQAPQAAASTGSTDVANAGKFETVAKPEAEAKDATEAQILGGGALATGNARSLSLTTSGSFRMRRERNQFSAIAAANYGRAAVDPDAETETTVENFQGRARYDRFVAGEFSVFLAASARRDRFQGLNLRLNIDPGVAYYFVDQEKQQLWGEFGYDFQYDVRRQDAIDAAAAADSPVDVDKTKSAHFGRLFVGYNNALNDAVTFKTGIEYLQGLNETKSWRLNYDAGLSSKIGGNFSLATTFSLRYDHNPLPGIKNTDTQTAVSLVYTLL